MSGINLSYVVDQLRRALGSGNPARAAKWQQVLEGLQSGALAVGSRQPVKEMPV